MPTLMTLIAKESKKKSLSERTVRMAESAGGLSLGFCTGAIYGAIFDGVSVFTDERFIARKNEFKLLDDKSAFGRGYMSGFIAGEYLVWTATGAVIAYFVVSRIRG